MRQAIPLVNADRRRFRQLVEWADAADAVPGVLDIRLLALALVALQKSRHEEFLSQRGQLHAAGLTVVDDQVRVIQTGTSSVSPEEILKAWEAAVADKPLNHFYNRGTSNGNVSNRLDVSTRTDPVQKVRLEARRGVGEKITQVTISLELPKPYED